MSKIVFDIEKPAALMSKADEVDDKVREALTGVLEELKDVLVSISPVKTGGLVSSYYYEVQGSTGFVSNLADYLHFVIKGRGWVFPVEKKALYWEELPHPVAYARPAEGHDYFREAMGLADVISEVESVFVGWLRS